MKEIERNECKFIIFRGIDTVSAIIIIISDFIGIYLNTPILIIFWFKILKSHYNVKYKKRVQILWKWTTRRRRSCDGYY